MDAQNPFVASETLSTESLMTILPLPDAPIHLDIGTGLGHFLADLAARHPVLNWVGLEYDGKIIRRAIRRVRRQAPGNARLLAMHARPFLLESVPPNTLAHIWLNFPDPWHKKRHAEKRHTNPWMLGLMVSRLRIGGEIHLATDVPAFFEAMTAGLADISAVEKVADTPWRRETLGVQTKYERKWTGQGKPLFFADWRKTAESTPYPFDRQPDPQFSVPKLPPPGKFGSGRYTAKVFPARKQNPQQAGFYLIDHQLGLSTPGYFDAGAQIVRLKGAWTPWKIELMAQVIHA